MTRVESSLEIVEDLERKTLESSRVESLEIRIWLESLQH